MVELCQISFYIALVVEILSVIQIVISRVKLSKNPNLPMTKRLLETADFMFAFCLAARGILGYYLGISGWHLVIMGTVLGVYALYLRKQYT